jgi:hypothetical protein
MKRLEKELLNAMRSEEPPEGFAERVLARTTETKQGSLTGLFAWRNLKWVLACSALLVLIVAGIEYRHVQEERARSEAAKAQLMLALRIAGDQIQYVQSKINQP